MIWPSSTGNLLADSMITVFISIISKPTIPSLLRCLLGGGYYTNYWWNVTIQYLEHWQDLMQQWIHTAEESLSICPSAPSPSLSTFFVLLVFRQPTLLSLELLIISEYQLSRVVATAQAWNLHTSSTLQSPAHALSVYLCSKWNAEWVVAGERVRGHWLPE